MEILIALAVALQTPDPQEFLREMMRRAMESESPGDPATAQNVLSSAVRNPQMSPAIRLEAAETLMKMRDRDSWVGDIASLSQDTSMTPEMRVRASLLLSEAGDPRASNLARDLDNLLFEAGDDASAEAIGGHLRATTQPELQGHQTNLLMKMDTPAAGRVLWDTLADEKLDPSLRLSVAEKLHAAGRLDKVQTARAALTQIRAADPSLAERVDLLMTSLAGIYEEPAARITPERTSGVLAAAVSKADAVPDPGSPWRVNLFLGGVTAVMAVLLFVFRRRA